MVDVVLYTEKLTPQRLERIMLGGLHPQLPRVTVPKDRPRMIKLKDEDLW